MFDKPFDEYVCEGDEITCKEKGFTVKATIHDDPDMGPPWKEHDGHGSVSDWRPRDSKRPWEKILTEDRGSCRFYDWQEAIKTAKTDGWDAPPYGEGTPGQRAERAVQRDFEMMQDWCNDGWWWGYVTLSVYRNGIEVLDHAATLCGIAVNCGDDNSYLLEVANELLGEAIEKAEARVSSMVQALATPED